MRALDRFGRGLQHLLARRDIAGDGYHVDARMVDQRVADALAAAENDVDHSLRKNIGKQLCHLERRERRLFGGFEDDRVAAGYCRCQLPGHHHQRVVPGCNRTDNADGVAADHRGEARQVFAGNRSMLVSDRAGKEAEAIDDGGDFVIAHGVDRLATIERFQGREGIAVGFDGVGDLQQERGPFAGRRARPCGERAARGGNCRLDLCRRGLGQVQDGFGAARIEDRFLLLLTLDEGGTDEHLRFHDRSLSVCHLPLPAVSAPSRVR